MLDDHDRYDIALPASMVAWAKMFDRRWVKKKDAEEVQAFLYEYAHSVVEATEKVMAEKLEERCFMRLRMIKSQNCWADDPQPRAEDPQKN
jgi:hypothetical protein